MQQVDKKKAKLEALVKRATSKSVPFENDTPEHEKNESASERKKEGE